MASSEWTLTCAPGSVGSVAKVMATVYSQLARDHPQLTKKELLVKTLRSRYPKISDARAWQMVKRGAHRLEYLILQVLWEEHSGYRKAFASNRFRYAEMLDTVKRMTDAHAPGA